jgi:coenzyme F420-reducing hydrogenase beta subunit
MRATSAGGFVPAVREECPALCHACRDVCPFALDPVADETSLAADVFNSLPDTGTPLGRVLGTYVGFRNDQSARERSASGGLASWLLEQVLERGIVDAVVAVAQVESGRQEGDAFLGYTVMTDPGMVSRGSGSCYCATHLDEALSAALAVHERIAVIGLPCAIKGLRLAARRNPALGEAVVLAVGLVCGQVKTWSFLRRIVTERTSVSMAEVTSVRFRQKVAGLPATRWSVGIAAGESRASTPFPFDLWTNRAYSLQACDACDDAFAETADVVFMDAWAEPYSADYRGHSFVITRSPDVDRLLAEGATQGAISVESVDSHLVLESQRGVVREKSAGLAYRLAVWSGAGAVPPCKRVSADAAAGSALERVIWRLEARIRGVSEGDPAGTSGIGGSRSMAGRLLALARRAQPRLDRLYRRLR